jgi:hypothetical protein
MVRSGISQNLNIPNLLDMWKGNACRNKVVPVFFVTEHHAMQAYWGNEGIAPRIL